MQELGSRLKKIGGWLRSDHSPGSIPFEEGAEENTILYLPAPQWNADVPYKTKHIVPFSTLKEKNPEMWDEAMLSVQEYYKDKPVRELSPFQLWNLARMYLVIMGTGTKPVDVVIYWKKKKKKDKDKTEEDLEQEAKEELFGNVELAVKIAEDYDIKSINLSDKFYRDKDPEILMSYIEKIVANKKKIIRETNELLLQEA